MYAVKRSSAYDMKFEFKRITQVIIPMKLCHR